MNKPIVRFLSTLRGTEIEVMIEEDADGIQIAYSRCQACEVKFEWARAHSVDKPFVRPYLEGWRDTPHLNYTLVRKFCTVDCRKAATRIKRQSNRRSNILTPIES